MTAVPVTRLLLGFLARQHVKLDSDMILDLGTKAVTPLKVILLHSRDTTPNKAATHHPMAVTNKPLLYV